MNQLTLGDRPFPGYLYPFTLTQSAADIRVGILTIREKWERLFGISVATEVSATEQWPVVPANLIPDSGLASAIENFREYSSGQPELAESKRIQFPWEILELNETCLRKDFELITNGRTSAHISATNHVREHSQIFLEPGAKVEYASLNASAGPIYVGKGAEIMEGTMIRGPFALGEGSVVKMGSVIYGATTIGPHSVIGGEIKNSVIFGYSNKAHLGYLGDSVIGNFCNLGAGTSNSNVKNSASEIRVWSEPSARSEAAPGKCGLFMGDYSRSAINTSFNTGTVVGVGCNVFGKGLTPKHIPSFSWGFDPIQKYRQDYALRDIRHWKKTKNQMLRDDEIQTLTHIFELS